MHASCSELRRIVGSLAAAVSLCNCATSSGDRATRRPGGKKSSFVVKQDFPTREELESIARREPPPSREMFPVVTAPASSWSMAGTVPQTYGRAISPGTALGEALASALDGHRRVRVDEGMMCYAEQYGRFTLEHGAEPSTDIRSFMTARCGLAVPRIAVAAFEQPAGKWDLKIVPDRDGEMLQEALSKAPKGSWVGAWTGQNADTAKLVLAFATPMAQVEPFEMNSGDSGFVELRGELAFEPEWVLAHSTRGRLGHATCQPLTDAQVPSQGFALRCPVDPSDPMAIIELTAGRRGELLGTTLLRAFVSPDGSMPIQYQAPSLSLPIDAQAFDRASMVAGINAVRRQASLEPLGLSNPQSDLADHMLPHLLAARFQGSEEVHPITLGLMAGWDVEDTIRNASIRVTQDHRERDLSRTIAASLFSPGYRATVLDPEAKIIALGAVEDPQSAARGSVVLTYQVFEPRDFGPDEVAFFDELDRQRAALSLPPVLRVQGPNDRAVLDAAAERIRDQGSDPAEELGVLVRHFRDQTRRGFAGFVHSPMLLEGWKPQFPRELLLAEEVAIAVKISYFKPEGAAWGQHVVLVVYTEL